MMQITTADAMRMEGLTANNAYAYFDNHAVCPECGSDNNYRTTAGGCNPTIDENCCNCECGWSGRVHDLVPRSDQPPSLDPPADPPQPIIIDPGPYPSGCDSFRLGSVGQSTPAASRHASRPAAMANDPIARMSRDHFDRQERANPIAHTACGGGYALDNLADVLLVNDAEQPRLFGLTADQTAKLRAWCRERYAAYLAAGVHLPVMFTMRIQLGRAGTEVQIRYEGERGKPESVLALTMLT